MSSKISVSVVLLLVLTLSGFGQDPASRDAEAIKAKRAKIIDNIVRESAELRLAV